MSSVLASKSTASSAVKLLNVLLGVFILVLFCFDSVNSQWTPDLLSNPDGPHGCEINNREDETRYYWGDKYCEMCTEVFPPLNNTCW